MRDVILTFFASKAVKGCELACSEPVEMLSRPSSVYSFDGENSGGTNTDRFTGIAKKYRNPVTKRILPNLLEQARRGLRLGDEPIGRVAIVTFSAGRYMMTECLKHPADRASIDTVIDMDGLNTVRMMSNNAPALMPPDASGYYYQDTPGIGPFRDFGGLCLDGTHCMVNWHTDVPSGYASVAGTKESCLYLYDVLSSMAAGVPDVVTQKWSMDTLMAGPPPPEVTTPAQSDIARVWSAMPPLVVTPVGNAFRVYLPGQGAAGGVHIFSGYWGQGAVWRTFLVPRWNGEALVSCTDTSGVAQDAGASCSKIPATLVDNDSLDEDVQLGGLFDGARPAGPSSGGGFLVGLGSALAAFLITREVARRRRSRTRGSSFG